MVARIGRILGAMLNHPENDRQRYERYAKECLELAKRTNDPAARANLTEMATAWLKFAWDIASQLPDDYRSHSSPDRFCS
jgi:hypothetical protein